MMTAPSSTPAMITSNAGRPRRGASSATGPGPAFLPTTTSQPHAMNQHTTTISSAVTRFHGMPTIPYSTVNTPTIPKVIGAAAATATGQGSAIRRPTRAPGTIKITAVTTVTHAANSMHFPFVVYRFRLHLNGRGPRHYRGHMDWPRRIPTLTDDVITLRPLETGDIPSVLAASQDPVTMEFTVVPNPYTEADARDFVESRLTRVWPGFDVAIVDRDGIFLGLCGLRAEDDDAVTKIGYSVAPQARGRGVATRATRLLIGYSWQIGALRVGLDVYASNAASRAVAGKCGFVEEGVLRSAAVGTNGKRHDLVVHGLLRSDPGAI